LKKFSTDGDHTGRSAFAVARMAAGSGSRGPLFLRYNSAPAEAGVVSSRKFSSERNGQEVLDLVEQLHPDIIVMDVTMPVMNS